jgi:bifunctional non-homologous end joining protein LigD
MDALYLPQMKASDLRSQIDWSATGASRFSGITEYFSSGWIMEPKYDGARLRVEFGSLTNQVRSSVDRAGNFPHLASAVVPALRNTVLEGELLAPSRVLETHRGTWTNSLLNASVALVNSNPVGSVLTQRRFGKAQLHVFDILSCQGVLTLELSLAERRQLLESVVTEVKAVHPGCEIHLIPQLSSSAASIESSVASGHEGVMIKYLSSRYLPGKRTKWWFKAKSFSTAEAFICGYAPGKNGNLGQVGSLNLAVERENGSVRPCAQVGNLSADLRATLTAPDGSLRPECYGMVVEFSCQGLQKSGRARHASLVRLRPDKTADECFEGQLDGFPSV